MLASTVTLLGTMSGRTCRNVCDPYDVEKRMFDRRTNRLGKLLLFHKPLHDDREPKVSGMPQSIIVRDQVGSCSRLLLLKKRSELKVRLFLKRNLCLVERQRDCRLSGKMSSASRRLWHCFKSHSRCPCIRRNERASKTERGMEAVSW